MCVLLGVDGAFEGIFWNWRRKEIADGKFIADLGIKIIYPSYFRTDYLLTSFGNFSQIH
jgi:hypothetical protein